MKNVPTRIEEIILIEEKVTILLIRGRNKGGLNTGEVTRTGGRITRIDIVIRFIMTNISQLTQNPITKGGGKWPTN